MKTKTYDPCLFLIRVYNWGKRGFFQNQKEATSNKSLAHSGCTSSSATEANSAPKIIFGCRLGGISTMKRKPATKAKVKRTPNTVQRKRGETVKKDERQNILCWRWKMSQVEDKVIEAVRKSPSPPNPREVVEKVVDVENSTVRQTIRSLVDRGELEVTLDWKLRVKKSTES